VLAIVISMAKLNRSADESIQAGMSFGLRKEFQWL
jgi:hypothetical protein